MRNRATIRSLIDGVNPPAIFISQSGQLPSPPTFAGRLTRFTKVRRQFFARAPDAKDNVARVINTKTPSLHAIGAVLLTFLNGGSIPTNRLAESQKQTTTNE